MKQTSELKTKWTKCPSILERVLKAVPKTAPAIFGSVLFLFVASPSHALILCRLGKEVRTLRTESGATSCKAIYTKQGIDSQIGGSTLNPTNCSTIIEGVRKNLEAGGWKCKEAKEAKISELQSAEGAQ